MAMRRTEIRQLAENLAQSFEVDREEKPIIFETEDSLWQTMASGERSFDMRRWDLSDHRIYRLSLGHWEKLDETLGALVGRQPEWTVNEPFISFRNKATTEILVCRYSGMEFTRWAPGWVFLIFTGIIRRVLPAIPPK